MHRGEKKRKSSIKNVKEPKEHQMLTTLLEKIIANVSKERPPSRISFHNFQSGKLISYFPREATSLKLMNSTYQKSGISIANPLLRFTQKVKTLHSRTFSTINKTSAKIWLKIPPKTVLTGTLTIIIVSISTWKVKRWKTKTVKIMRQFQRQQKRVNKYLNAKRMYIHQGHQYTLTLDPVTKNKAKWSV